MANSLRDELLKAGLVTEQQVHDADQRRRRPPTRPADPKRSRHGARQSARPKPVRDSPAVQQRRETDARASERRKKEEEQKARKAARSQVRALLSRERQNDPKAEISHKFLIGNQIKGVYVTADQHKALSGGGLAIVYFEKRAHLLALEIAEKVRAITPSTFIHLGGKEEATDDNDPYAGYDVPDDLVW